ncbi:hypothetical protein BH24ACT4_BH24ACT4_00600 [soil metagenome]
MRDEVDLGPIDDDGDGDAGGLLDSEPLGGEEAAEAGLRPRTLADFVGQSELKEHLAIILEAARLRGQAADHLLFAGPPGLGKPVAVDTLVLMGDGSRRRIGDLAPGDTVITHQGRPRPVLDVHDQGELPCLEIITATGRSVVAAHDHPFLTPYGWTKAADLRVGEVLANVGRPETDARPSITVEEARLAGYVVGDGAVKGSCHITNGDLATIVDIERCLDVLGFPHHQRPNSAHSVKVKFSGANDWLERLDLRGHTAHDKRVPASVFTEPREVVAEFLAAYFACDGTVSRRGRDRWDAVVEFYSVNRDLLVDVQHLLLRLGVQSRLKGKKGRYQGGPHSSWRLTITRPDDVARFAETIPVIGDTSERPRDWAPRRDRFEQAMVPDSIELIDDVGLVECRCIMVAEDESYTVGDLVCHNTTLAGIVATEIDVALHVTSGPALERAGDLAAILSQLSEGDVLFIDEIHRLSRVVEEVLYPAMEDFVVDIVLGKGPAARTIRIDVPRFTLVGATTRTGLITGPLRDRFGLVARLDFYEPADLEAIVLRAAEILDVTIDVDGAREIARRARGTPRIANRLLRRVRDFAEVRGTGAVDLDAARAGLKVFGVDQLGLDKTDRAVLDALCRRFGGGPVGPSTLSISVAEPTETVEDVHEPFLIREGLLMRTPRGRVATPAAWAHLGLTAPRTAPGNDTPPPGLFG